MKAKTNLGENIEEYLESISRINDRDELATISLLAKDLNIAPPSALEMIAKLRRLKLINYNRKSGIKLTKTGEQRARTLCKRHRLAERMLTDLVGIPWDKVHSLACKLEHIIDDEFETYLAKALNHPSECPHGHPIDGKPSEKWKGLNQIPAGTRVVLRCINNESSELLKYLAANALNRGAIFDLTSIDTQGGIIWLSVAGKAIPIGSNIGQHLLVERSG